MTLIRKAEKTLSNNFLVIAVLFIGLMTVFSTQVLADETKPHWSYGGASNPTQWGQINGDFALCELGRDQSPININDAIKGSPVNINFNYQPTPLSVVNNGHTVCASKLPTR